MASEAEPSVVDFDKQEDFVFNFDVALAPAININLSKDDTLTYYQVKIDDEMLNKQVEAYTANFGTYEKVEEVEEKDLVKGTVAELENGSPKEGGIVVENAVLMPQFIKDAAIFFPADLGNNLLDTPVATVHGNDHIGFIQASEGNQRVTLVDTLAFQYALIAAVTVDHRGKCPPLRQPSFLQYRDRLFCLGLSPWLSE